DKRYFLLVNGKKVYVDKDVYLAYHSELNKEKYLYKRDGKNGCLFFSNLDHDGNFDGNLEDKSVNIEKMVETKEVIEKLNHAISKLTKDERDLIVKIFYEDKTLRQIGKILNISPPSVMKRRNKILDKLRKFLDEYNI
ncbi:RNA polymerase sigma factor, partial [Peptococcus simiae]|uniref:RNA polymerase sigma factor n=1 Tax=Peptococcus simiae TaxID=1643805 RepID=UPI00397F634C